VTVGAISIIDLFVFLLSCGFCRIQVVFAVQSLLSFQAFTGPSLQTILSIPAFTLLKLHQTTPYTQPCVSSPQPCS
jgi:hypothetical protein